MTELNCYHTFNDFIIVFSKVGFMLSFFYEYKIMKLHCGSLPLLLVKELCKCTLKLFQNLHDV